MSDQLRDVLEKQERINELAQEQHKLTLEQQNSLFRFILDRGHLSPTQQKVNAELLDAARIIKRKCREDSGKELSEPSPQIKKRRPGGGSESPATRNNTDSEVATQISQVDTDEDTEVPENFGIARTLKPRGVKRLLRVGKYTNTCYLSVVLQALATIDPVWIERQMGTTKIGNEPPCSIRHKNSPSDYELCFRNNNREFINPVWEFINVIKKLRTEAPNPDPGVIPYALQYSFSRSIKAPKYEGETQQDSDEWLNDFLYFLRSNEHSKRELINALYRQSRKSTLRCKRYGSTSEAVAQYQWVHTVSPSEKMDLVVGEREGGKAGAKVTPAEMLERSLHQLPEGACCPTKHCDCQPTMVWSFEQLPQHFIFKFDRTPFRK
jgi:hypothetical protein